MHIFQRDWSYLKGLQLAVPGYYKPSIIDIVLGADIYISLSESGIKRGLLEELDAK
jgi:hypothetical protein